jgi:hypothetical protein
MEKLITVILLFISSFTFAQNDTSKYYRSNDYGWSQKRFQAREAMVIPTDTTNNKLGIARKGSSLFIGNGVKWSAITGGSGGGLDSVTVSSDSLFYWAGGSSYFITNLATAAAGGDTTIFNTVIDTTGQSNQRVLFAKNNKISSDSKLYYNETGKLTTDTASLHSLVLIDPDDIEYIDGKDGRIDFTSRNFGGVVRLNTEFNNDVAFRAKDSVSTYYNLLTQGADGFLHKVPKGISSTTLSDSLAGFIPLSGTRVGKPVTGVIEFQPWDDGDEINLGFLHKSAGSDNSNRVYFDNYGQLDISSYTNSTSQGRAGMSLYNGTAEFYNTDTTGSDITRNALVFANDGLGVKHRFNGTYETGTYKGLIGYNDFSPNYNYLTYVQKLYVDRVADSLRNYADSIGTIGVNIYNSDGTLTGNRVVTTGGYYLNILGSGAKSTAIGNNSLSSGDSSIAIGNNSLSNSAKGVSIGNYAGYGSTNAIVAIGNNAANGSTGSIVAIGTNAGVNNSANNVTAIGTTAGNNNIGINGTFLGANAGRLNTGSSVTALGKDALNDNSGNETVAIGVVSGRTNTGKAGVYIGNGSGDANIGDSSVLIGYGAGHNNIGSRSVGIGTYSLDNNSGHRVTSIGDSSGVYNTFNSVVNLGIKAISTSNNQLSLSDSIFKIKARGLAKGISGYVLTDTTGNGDLALSSLGNYLLISDSVANTGFASRGRLTKVADSLIVVANTNYLPKASPSFTGLLSGVGTTQTGSSAVGVVDLSQTWNTTGNVTGIKLNVTNTASDASSKYLEFQLNGVGKFYVTRAGQILCQSILGLSNTAFTSTYVGAANQTINLGDNTSQFSYINNTATTSTTGTNYFSRLSPSFAPTSGTAVWNTFAISPTINQTGGANGITRGLYVNPTLTAAADFRAIETTVGKVIFNGTGNVLVGTTTDVASSKLTVESTTQGFLPPRMTTTERNAIASPATGLMVFDTTLAKLCVYTGAAWETITSL